MDASAIDLGERFGDASRSASNHVNEQEGARHEDEQDQEGFVLPYPVIVFRVDSIFPNDVSWLGSWFEFDWQTEQLAVRWKA